MARSKKHSTPRLSDLDLTLKLDATAYERQLLRLQEKLSVIQQAYLVQGHNGVIVFEGWDAAGKGGTIRRLSAAFDPRSFKVWPIGAPRNYYLNRHHLLRFMERLPPKGAISVFDRSWYGRVLVERVEALTHKDRWRAAYREINDFERMLTDDGVRVIKIFMHISAEEQLRRFEQRLRNPRKRWKLTYEDFRNRANWDAYNEAADEMFAKTSTRHAPWTLVPSENKKHGRIAAITEIVKRLGKGIDLTPPAMDENVVAAAIEHFDLEPELVARLSGRTE
ncbi:MAG: polyphosphate kinase [Pseudomonadota bacterium]